MRVDEITLHPRDNAMIVATHGRALWILDHLEPIQEYAAAQAADAKLFSPGPALQWKTKDDRNDEFWGHQFFIGENPPAEAVIQFHLKKRGEGRQAQDHRRGRQGGARGDRSGQRNQPGIQTVCWDMRVEPIPAAAGRRRRRRPDGRWRWWWRRRWRRARARPPLAGPAGHRIPESVRAVLPAAAVVAAAAVAVAAAPTWDRS